MNKPIIFCAVDTTDLDLALKITNISDQNDCGIKIGLEFFNSNGPDGLKKLKNQNPSIPIFLDLKFHDIPNTVSSAIKAVMPLEPAYLNVHATGGLEMMIKAKETIFEISEKNNYITPKLLAVTILTSLDGQSMEDIGFSNNIDDTVLNLAKLTKKAGLNGVVCSAKEVIKLRQTMDNEFVLMVPGIRPENNEAQDQKRTMSPMQAIKNGASHLVIGRPITQSKSPEQTLQDILKTIKNIPQAA